MPWCRHQLQATSKASYHSRVHSGANKFGCLLAYIAGVARPGQARVQAQAIKIKLSREACRPPTNSGSGQSQRALLMAGRLLLWRGSSELTCRLVQRSVRARNRLLHVFTVRCQTALSSVSLVSPTEHTTQHLASLLAQRATLGDCFCLYGDVGAGKSVLR